MDDESNIWFINTHTKGDGGYHDLGIKKKFLLFISSRGIKARI